MRQRPCLLHESERGMGAVMVSGCCHGATRGRFELRSGCSGSVGLSASACTQHQLCEHPLPLQSVKRHPVQVRPRLQRLDTEIENATQNSSGIRCARTPLCVHLAHNTQSQRVRGQQRWWSLSDFLRVEMGGVNVS